MSTVTDKKIKCISRLEKLSNSFALREFLVDRGFLSLEELQLATTEQEKAETMFLSIRRAVEDKRIDLAHFDWTLLPSEKISIRIVTEFDSVEFAAYDMAM